MDSDCLDQGWIIMADGENGFIRRIIINLEKLSAMHAGVSVMFNDVSQETDFAGSQAWRLDFHERRYIAR
jgi:hypothetical protein